MPPLKYATEQTEFASFVARMKKHILSKVYAFRFRRRSIFHRRTNKTATL